MINPYIAEFIQPDYYSRNGIEAIDYIDAHSLNFALGNVIKYVTRAGHKDGEDTLTALYKARWYLNHEIDRRKKQFIRGGGKS